MFTGGVLPMPSIFARLCLFFSSYFPLWVILYFVLLDDHFRAATAVLIAGGICTLIALIYFWSLTKTAPERVTIAEWRRRDDDVLSYLVTYVIPFMISPDDGWQKAVGLGLFLLVVCVLYVKTNMVYINPTLALFGYRLYEVKLGDDESTHPLITRRKTLVRGNLLVVAVGNDVFFSEEGEGDDGTV